MTRDLQALLDRPLANPPARLPAELTDLWYEILFACPKNYVLRRDSSGFEHLVTDAARYRRGELSKTRTRGLMLWMGKFGIKPKDRQRVLDGKAIG